MIPRPGRTSECAAGQSIHWILEDRSDGVCVGYEADHGPRKVPSYLMHSRITRFVLFLILVGVCAGTGLADEPPSWEPFEECSADGRYCAVVEPSTDSAPPWDAEHQLKILENFEDRRRQVWSSRFEYDGYSGGLLTSDGDTFVRVSRWYYIDTVVSIYRRGRRFDIVGRAFRIPRDLLEKTASHQLWLKDQPEPYRFAEKDVLAITTIDGREHRIDLVTGEFVKEAPDEE